MTNPPCVFTYGALSRRGDVPHLDARCPHIEGWTCRFWQGSRDHCGMETERLVPATQQEMLS